MGNEDVVFGILASWESTYKVITSYSVHSVSQALFHNILESLHSGK